MQAAGPKSIKLQAKGCGGSPACIRQSAESVLLRVSALMGALAWVLFAADVRTALLAAFLASALFDAGGAWQGFGGLAIGFGNDFVAHDDS